MFKHQSHQDSPQYSSKSELRRRLKDRRAQISLEEHRIWNALIVENLFNFISRLDVSRLGVYSALPGEPDLSALYPTLCELGITLALPVVIARNAPLQFSAWRPGDALLKGNYCVDVPATFTPVDFPQALVIPCLGYTPDHYRLGYGGGYYDRTLESANPRPYTIGISYHSLQLKFSPSLQDVPLDCVVTERT